MTGVLPPSSGLRLRNPPSETSDAPADVPERYARQVILPGFGPEAQLRLARARVLVVGAGGLGSPVIQSLAAAGVGTIGIIDGDVVETSNLARQTIHGPADVGRSKVASAAETVALLNPAVIVHTHARTLQAADALDVFSGYDLVVDGSDNFPTRYLTNDAALLCEVPVVWGAVHQYGGQVGVSWGHRGPHYRDLFPEPPAPESVESCSQAGVLSTVCAIIGGVMSTEAIKLLTAIGTPLLGRVTAYDALRGTFREIPFAPDPAAAPVTGLVDYDVFCGVGPLPGNSAVDPRELADRMRSGEDIALVDVRTPDEAAVARIDGAFLLPLGDLAADPGAAAARLRALHVDARTGRAGPDDSASDTLPTVVLYCHHGPRSERALALLAGAGLGAMSYLRGGIDAWSRQVDAGIGRY